MAQTPEGRVKAGVKRHLDAMGAWYFMPVSNGMGRHGIPDFLACIDGEFVAIECKSPGKSDNTTAHQTRELGDIAGAGGRAMVIDDPDTFPNYLATLRAVRPGTGSGGALYIKDGVAAR